MQKLYLVLLVALAGCAYNAKTVFVDRKIEGPKIVALDAPRTPWIDEIESRLRQTGFQVMRGTIQLRDREQLSASKSEGVRETAARYILVIQGSAPLDAWRRCVGGGYQFDSISAELVDTTTKETMFSVTGSGYSENCPPVSGDIFSNITKAMSEAWR